MDLKRKRLVETRVSFIFLAKKLRSYMQGNKLNNIFGGIVYET